MPRANLLIRLSLILSLIQLDLFGFRLQALAIQETNTQSSNVNARSEPIAAPLSAESISLGWLTTYLLNVLNVNEFFVTSQRDNMNKSPRSKGQTTTAVNAMFSIVDAIRREQFLGSNLSRELLNSELSKEINRTIPHTDLKLVTESATFQLLLQQHRVKSDSPVSQFIVDSIKVPKGLEEFTAEFQMDQYPCQSRPLVDFSRASYKEKTCLLVWEFLLNSENAINSETVKNSRILEASYLDPEVGTSTIGKMIFTLIALKNEAYPTALSHLHDLSQSDPRFQNLYNRTQKIYAARVKSNKGAFLEGIQ